MTFLGRILGASALATALFTGFAAYILWRRDQSELPYIEVSLVGWDDSSSQLGVTLDGGDQTRYAIARVAVPIFGGAKIALRVNEPSGGPCAQSQPGKWGRSALYPVGASSAKLFIRRRRSNPPRLTVMVVLKANSRIRKQLRRRVDLTGVPLP